MDGALATGLDPAAGRLEQHREIAGNEVRTLGEEAAQPVELLRDLFGLVEDHRRVETGPGRVGSQRVDEREQHGEPALHVGGAEPVERVAVPTRDLVAVGCDGVEMAREHHPLVAAQIGTDDDVVADPVHHERRGVTSHPRLDDVGEARLVPAHRRDRDQLLGEPEQIHTHLSRSWPCGPGRSDHTPLLMRHRVGDDAAPLTTDSRADAAFAQDLVELGLVVALALGEPLHDEDAGQPEVPTGKRPGPGRRPPRRTSRGRGPGSARRRSPRR